MEEIKQKIAEENGFNNWDMMVRCYCTTKPGQNVLKKETDRALNIYIVGNRRELLETVINELDMQVGTSYSNDTNLLDTIESSL